MHNSITMCKEKKKGELVTRDEGRKLDEDEESCVRISEDVTLLRGAPSKNNM